MLSRIMWMLIAGLALVAGMAVQDGDRFFSWGDDAKISSRTEHKIDVSVDRVVDRAIDRMRITDPSGQELDASPEAKRALADAVSRLVEAEASLAVLRIRDRNSPELPAARARRDHARAEVDTLKDAIRQQQQAPTREQIRQEVRDDIRDTVRDAVRN
jgi:hypothetical protein